MFPFSFKVSYHCSSAQSAVVKNLILERLENSPASNLTLNDSKISFRGGPGQWHSLAGVTKGHLVVRQGDDEVIVDCHLNLIGSVLTSTILIGMMSLSLKSSDLTTIEACVTVFGVWFGMVTIRYLWIRLRFGALMDEALRT